MAQAAASVTLAIPADHVWALIGGFGALPDWLPFIPRSELLEGGRVRRLTTIDGANIMERLIRFDHAARSYSYTILEAPFPVARYLSTLRATELADGGSSVDWSGEFAPDGVGEAEVSALFQGIYGNGLAALAAHYAAAR